MNILEKDFIDKMRDLLLREREELLKSINYTENDKKDIIEHDNQAKDIADIAFENMDGNNLEALSSVEKKKLNLINQALNRIHNHTYGKCLSCEENIAKARLKALPYAVFCITCQEEYERKSRR